MIVNLYYMCFVESFHKLDRIVNLIFISLNDRPMKFKEMVMYAR